MADASFEHFWKAYPRRVGKLAAEKAYTKARKIATAEDILAGIEQYKRNKPTYADFAHPSSWLNAGRWMDEYDVPKSSGGASWVCPHTPACERWQWCQVKSYKERAVS